MRTRRFLWLWLSVLAVLAVSLGACGDDDDDDSDDDDTDDDDSGDDDDDSDEECDWAVHDPLIVAGKQQLADSLVYEAYETFDDALAVCPDSMDARMGLALANQLELEREMYDMIDYLLSVYPDTKGDRETKSFMSVLQAILLYQIMPKALEMREHARIVQQAPAGWSFYVEEYPFIVQGEFTDEVFVDMGGEWDHADARMLEAEAEGYIFLTRFIDAYDLTLDWYWTQHFPEIDFDFTDPDSYVAALHAIAGWLYDVIEDPNYPMFLLLKGDYGMDSLTEAGVAFANACAMVNEAARMALEETDDQTDDVAGYVDENGNGQWDEGEPFFLPYIGGLSPDQDHMYWGLLDLLSALAASARDGGEFDENPGEPDEVLLSDFNFLLEALGFEGILPEIGGSIGPYFNDPNPVALKEFLRTWTRFLYEATGPELGEAE